MPRPHRARPRQLHNHQAYGSQPDPQSARQRLSARSAQGRRLGRRFPRKPHQCLLTPSPDCPARKLRGGTMLSRWLLQAGERKSGRSSGHGKSSGAVYPFWLSSARTESFVKLTTWSGPAGQGHRNHKEMGLHVHLLVRKTKKTGSKPTPFTYCGEVDFQSWVGNTPITVT